MYVFDNVDSSGHPLNIIHFLIFLTGTNLMSENAIVDLPTGVVTFYMDLNEPRTPGI